ncbi:MAG: urea ABC transporter permease subunit UrtB [Pseudomonadota bacterium]|jgi:urea transport system permease protein
MLKNIFFILCLMIYPIGANAQTQADLASLVQQLADKSRSTQGEAIDALAATGEASAIAPLEALLNGRLYTRKSDDSVWIVTESATGYELIHPLSGESAGSAASDEMSKANITNSLRTKLRGALGSMTLLSPDPALRRQAADAIFKNAAPDSIPLLESAIAKETSSAVRRRMQRALAGIQLDTSTDPVTRLNAIAALGEFTDQEVRALLGNVAGRSAEAAGGEEVRAAAQSALAGVESRLQFWGVAESVFQGLSLGSVLLLAAIGLAITFGVMGVINMAHGEMVMLGAYTTYIVQEIIRTSWPGLFDASLFIAIPAAFMVAGIAGIAIERGIIRFLYGRPLETLLATWGISLILQQSVRSIFGPTNKEVGTPSWMSGAMEFDSGLVLTYNRLTIILFALMVLGALALVLRKTSFGLRMRAVTQNRGMASSLGIQTGRIDALTFGLGSGIAGIAGVALSQIDNVSPNLGQGYIVDSFMVVVFGGVGNLLGTFFGAVSLGLVNKFLEPYAGAVLGKIFVLAAIILFIQYRPRGLFALKGRAVEN